MSDSEFSDVEEETGNVGDTAEEGEREAWSDEEEIESSAARVDRAPSSDEETFDEKNAEQQMDDAGDDVKLDEESSLGPTPTPVNDADDTDLNVFSLDESSPGTPVADAMSLVHSGNGDSKNPTDMSMSMDESKVKVEEGGGEEPPTEEDEEDEEAEAAAAAAALLEEQAKLRAPEKLHSLVLEGLASKAELFAVREHFKAKAESGKGGSVGPQVTTFIPP
jgi:hypothetical protein